MKVSELPFAFQADAAQQIPAFLDEQRKLKVDRIFARYPRGTVDYFQSRILECESNMRRFAQLKKDMMGSINEYMNLMRRREGDLSQAEVDEQVAQLQEEFLHQYSGNTEIVDHNGRPIPNTLPFRTLMGKLQPINDRLRLYEDEALWVQVGLFQESRDRFDLAVEAETNSIFALREAISMCHERDREIKKAMTEPLSVE
jgi:hypothetical protein